MDLYSAALGAAAHDLRRGVRESRENAGKEIGAMLANAGISIPAPWCAAAVQDWTDSAAKACLRRNPLDAVKLQAYVQSYHDWAMANSHLVHASQCKPGYLVLYNFGGNRFDHCGLVYEAPRSPAPGTVFSAIEGNTNAAGSREGDEVALRARKLIAGRVAFVAWAL